jgi:pyruvate formate lyase activating enzyme
MKYAGWMKQSLVDYPGEIATVLFTRGCNMRCPYCHNADLLIRTRENQKNDHDLAIILEFLKERHGFIDAVVISGGEPTLHPELISDIEQIKALGFKVKLDTNGTNPEMLAQLLERNLLDYVAMDVKHELEYRQYQQAAGKLSSEAFFHIKGSINLLRNADIDVEFRTTVVPVLHQPEDIVNIARALEGAKLYTLQQFNPRHTLNAAWATVVPYNREQMNDLAQQCAPYVKKIQVKNI